MLTGVTMIVEGAPVSGNAAYRFGRGRMWKTSAAVAWQEWVKLSIQNQRPACWELTGEKSLQLSYYFDSRRPDINNPCDLILDALQGVLYENDRQISTLIQHKRLDKLKPRVEVTVWNVITQQGALP